MLKMKNWMKYVAAFTAAASFMSAATARECLSDQATNKAFQVGKYYSRPIQTGQANNTWQDWIWEGPIFDCTSGWGNKCTYGWNQSWTQGYTWELGGSIEPGKIPVIGGLLSLFKIEGSYGKQKSYTQAFNWSQTFDGGQSARPIMIIQRRWIQGDFKGTDWRSGAGCYKQVWSNSSRSWSDQKGAYYWWDDNYRWGYWGTQAEQYRHSAYHWWWT